VSHVSLDVDRFFAKVGRCKRVTSSSVPRMLGACLVLHQDQQFKALQLRYGAIDVQLDSKLKRVKLLASL
jgi:hypothetical protein